MACEEGMQLDCFPPVQSAQEKRGGDETLSGTKESLYGCSSVPVIGVQDRIQTTSATKGRQVMMRTLHNALCMILCKLDEGCFHKLLVELDGTYG